MLYLDPEWRTVQPCHQQMCLHLFLCMLSVNNKYKIGPRALRCGTPAFIILSCYVELPTSVLKEHSER